MINPHILAVTQRPAIITTTYFASEPIYMGSLKAALFGSVLLIGLYSESPIFLAIGLGLAVILDRRLLLPALVVTPPIETLQVAVEGVTVTKLTWAFVAVYMGANLTLSGNLFVSSRFISTLCLLLVPLGIGYVLALESTHDWHGVTQYNAFVCIPKVVVAGLAFQYFSGMSLREFEETIAVAIQCVSIGLTVSLLYVLQSNVEFTEHYGTQRAIIAKADPNEFSCMVVALLSFPLSILFLPGTKALRVIAFCCVAFSGYMVLQTASRGGVISLGFTFLVAVFIYNRRDLSRASLYFIAAAVSVVFAISVGLIDIEPIFERFTRVEYGGNRTDVTGGRLSIWEYSLKAFLGHPIFGYGNAFDSAINAISLAGYTGISAHNTFLEVGLRFGLLGLIVFSAACYQALAPIIEKDAYKYLPTACFIPAVAFTSLLFSGMGLSWQWNELLWIFFGISAALVTKRVNYPLTS